VHPHWPNWDERVLEGVTYEQWYNPLERLSSRPDRRWIHHRGVFFSKRIADNRPVWKVASIRQPRQVWIP
jgi:hypothetical protein